MERKQQLEIILPDAMAEVPVRIIRGSNNQELMLHLKPTEEDDYDYGEWTKPKYAFIWRQNDYMKVALDDILWIEANGSYSIIHMTGKRTQTISFNLAVIGKKLPANDFIRIHRSHIVNLKRVELLIGNSLLVDKTPLAIGREYRDEIIGKFIFLGVRRVK